MSEFGEKVFAALAHQVDFNDVRGTQTTVRRVLQNVPNPGLDFGTDGPIQIENFKNAIFQLLMLRARNEFKLHSGTRKDSPGFVKVDLSIIFTPETIHPEAEKKDRDESLKTLGINPNLIFPIASDQYDSDTVTLLADFVQGIFPLACGD